MVEMSMGMNEILDGQFWFPHGFQDTFGFVARIITTPSRVSSHPKIQQFD